MMENRRVLLVDDDAEVLATYREVLSRRPRRRRRREQDAVQSFELSWVTSGEEAVELVRSELRKGRNFACGVFDMRMPGIDGRETIQEIRKLDRNLLCAVCTAYSDRSIDEIDELFSPSEKDQWDYLQKPIAASELLQKVRCLVSSWNRRRREEKNQARMAALIAQLSNMTSARPGDVESSLDLMINAVRDLTQASRGALLEDGPDDKLVLRSWSHDDDESWLGPLLRSGQSDLPEAKELVFFSVPSEGIQRTLVLSSPAESDRELLAALGLLLDNAARLITLNSELQITNQSLAAQCQALASARAQAIQSAKLAAIGQVAAGVAHEVNSPLSVIQLEAELVIDLIESGTLEPDCIGMSALQIQEEVQRIKNVVCEVRDFARKSTDRREPVPLSQVVDSALVILKHRLANDPVVLDVAMPDDLPDARGDKTQLVQVLVNLVSNALDAVQGTDHPRIGIKGCASPDRPGMVRVEVSDQGRGMDERVRAQALDPFFTTKEPGQGTGLGLVVVQTIIELHEGYLDLDTEPGRGTRVWIDLPAVARLRPVAEDPSVLRPRVLVLRADPEYAAATAEALRQAGAYPMIVASYREASEQLKRGEADLVLTDIEIQGASVWTLVDELSKHGDSPSPVLVIGRGPQTGQTREFQQLGISGQVAEPIDPAALQKLIRRVLGQRDWAGTSALQTQAATSP